MKKNILNDFMKNKNYHHKIQEKWPYECRTFKKIREKNSQILGFLEIVKILNVPG